MKQKTKVFIVSIVSSLAVGGLSALLTSKNMDIFSEIKKPPLSPPSILFPIVWSILFTLMGIGIALVIINKSKNRTAADSAIILFILNLAANFFWSLIFFNARAYLFAFFWLILLWILILSMILKFKKVSPIATYLQIPYLLWVTFAGYLTLAIYILNK